MTMWSSSDIQSSTNVSHHPWQRVEWTGEETLHEKMDRLNIGIGGSLTVDMNTAAVKASGSFRYITETRVRKYLHCVPFQSISHRYLCLRSVSGLSHVCHRLVSDLCKLSFLLMYFVLQPEPKILSLAHNIITEALL